MERSCRFVGVILHDGAKALVLRTKSKASMSGIMDGLAAVVGTATSEVLCGVYAAQFVARCKIGALWEFPSRGVGRESFEVKGATTRSGKHTAWHSVGVPFSIETLASELQRFFIGRAATPQMESSFFDLRFVRDGW